MQDKIKAREAQALLNELDGRQAQTLATHIGVSVASIYGWKTKDLDNRVPYGLARCTPSIITWCRKHAIGTESAR